MSAAVMTHPSRLRHAEQLRDRLPELDLAIVLDPAPEQGPCALRTARLAWQAVDPGATHHLVLQDDAVPCEGFADQVVRAVTACPQRPLSLHAEWGSETAYAVRLAALLGASLADVLDGYVPTIGMVLPAELARDFARFFGYDGPHDDVALRRFLCSVGVAASVTVPNLVDHAPLPSVAGNDFRGADRSVCWLPELGDVDWATGPPPLRVVPYLSWQNGRMVWRVPPDRPGDAWRGVPGQSVFQDLGLHEANVAGRGRASIRSVSCAVDPELLFTLWLAAYGLGVVAADLDGAESVADLLGTPVVGQALATMPGGALRFLLDSARLAEAGSQLTRLVELGVRQGHTAVRNVRRARW